MFEPISESSSPIQSSRKSRWRSGVRSSAIDRSRARPNPPLTSGARPNDADPLTYSDHFTRLFGQTPGRLPRTQRTVDDRAHSEHSTTPPRTHAREVRHGTLRLGDDAPNFTAETTEGTVDLYDYLGDSWGLLFSHPADFTPVCTTELGELAKRKGEFDQRNVKLIGLSVDPLESHKKWAPDIADVKGTALNYPLIADPDRKVAELYDMIHPAMNEKVTVRSVFIIGPDKKVKLIITYPQTTGRNIDELLRVIDSLQLTAGYSVATPVDWKQGGDVIIAGSVTDEAAKEKFPEGWKAEKPYLRWVAQPGK